MTIRWRRLLPILLPVALLAVAFSVYTSFLPSIRCVVINESRQTTIKASGKRCEALSSEEKAIVLTTEGAYIDGNNR